MKIHYENTIDDIIAFRRHHRDHSPDVQKGLRVVLIIPAAVFLALGVLAAAEWQDPTYVAGGVTIGLAWVGMFWLFIRSRYRASDRRLMRVDSTNNAARRHDLELTDGTLTERTDHGSHASSLHDVEKIESTNSHTFIYINSGGAYVIPRRSVPEGEYQEFVDAVRREWRQTETLAWRPTPAHVSPPEESTPSLPPVADTNPLGREERGLYRSRLGPKMRRCSACGKLTHRSNLTCRHCGRTWWAPIAIWFAAAVALKAGAVCAGLWLRNPWANNLAAWGGSILAGYMLLTAVSSVIDAFRTGVAVRRQSPGQRPDPVLMKAHAIGSGDSLLALAITIGFVIVGNTIYLQLEVCLGFTLGLFAVAVIFGMVRSAALSAAKRKLAARMVAMPETWPVVPQVSDGIIEAAGGTTTAPTSPAGLPVVQASPGAEVRLRVLGGGAWFVTNFSVVITLDGKVIGVGSLRRGFDARGETTTGVHELQVRWGHVTERFALYLPQAGAYEAELRYSSFWAKFLPKAVGIDANSEEKS